MRNFSLTIFFFSFLAHTGHIVTYVPVVHRWCCVCVPATDIYSCSYSRYVIFSCSTNMFLFVWFLCSFIYLFINLIVAEEKKKFVIYVWRSNKRLNGFPFSLLANLQIIFVFFFLLFCFCLFIHFMPICAYQC